MAYRRKQKMFPCPECIKDFDKESQLKKHMKDKHGKEVSYPISINANLFGESNGTKG